jgi:NitT/TauT family transport system permease protein
VADFWRRTERVRSVFLVLIVLTVLWEIAVRVFAVRTFILPAPSLVLKELMEAPAYFAKHSMFTLGTTALGFFIALVLGVGAAVGIVYSKFLDRVLSAVLVSLNAVPKVALAPLFVIWMGTGAEPKIAIAIMIAIFPIVIDTVLGLKSVDPEMLNLAKSCRASPLKTLFKIRFPNALPSIFAGMKVAISFALVGAIVGEFVAGDKGLGYVILLAQGNFDTPRVFVALALLGVLGTILFYLVDIAESLLLPWHVSQRGRDDGVANLPTV